MKSEKEVNAARSRIAERYVTPGLSDIQKALISGMLNALVWVADGKENSVMERLLSDEPIMILNE